MAARPGEGKDFAEIVAGAWDFERINRRYARHLKVLAERPDSAPQSEICDLQFEIKRIVGQGVAGRCDERPAAAGPDSAVGLSGAMGTVAAC